MPEPTPAAARESRDARQALVFFALSLAVFLATRLIGLERFPIYFFCDEAVQTVQAARLMNNGLRDEYGELLPTYFLNSHSRNLGVGVYLQVVPYVLFGRSVFVTRATQVAVLFSAMFALGLLMRDFFRLRFWWVVVPALSAFPGWFLHTRIAFELMLATSFYVWFLYFYLRYRSGRTREVLLAALFAALTFYAYNAFQPVIAVTGLLLTVADAPYHWKKRRMLAWALAFLVLLALPYARFWRDHSREIGMRLRDLDSYWLRKDTTAQKLATFGRLYGATFSPRYWFRPEPPQDLVRHQMKGRGYLPWIALPLALGGALLCARRIRDPGPRTLLVALAAAPVGAALVAPGITRAMTLVVVFAMLCAVAADWLLIRAARFVRPVFLGAAIFAALAVAQGRMLAEALRDGPTWFDDYGLNGMQWGARQVFDTVRRYRERYPRAWVLVTPVWANGTENLQQFFAPDDQNVLLANLDWLRTMRRELPGQTRLVMTEDEYRSALKDPLFTRVRVDETIPYPDGSPGFRVATLAYAPDFEAQLAAQRDARNRLVTESFAVGGETLSVEHSIFDMGGLSDLFDGDPESLVRTGGANPAVLVVSFPSPRPWKGFKLTTGCINFELNVAVSGPAGEAVAARAFRDLPPDSEVEFRLPESGLVSRVRIEVRDPHAGEPGYVHLRDLKFL